MWFEWLLRRCDMGALAVVSTLQPPSSVDQQGLEYTISQSAHDAASLWSKRKAEQRVVAPHIFLPALPLLGLPIIANELVSSSMWSPCFENSPCKDLGYHANPNGLKALSTSLLGDASNNGGTWVSEPLNQLAKNYLQTVQELKQSNFSHCQEAPLQPEQYKELKEGFWKQLASDPLNDKLSDFASMSGAQASNVRGEGNLESSNPTAKTTTLSRLQGSSTKRGGYGLNGSVEIEVVLTGKWNALPAAEATMNPKQELVADQIEEDSALHVQNKTFVKDFQHCQELNLSLQDGIDQSSVVEKDPDDDICRTGASSREASDGESLGGHNVARFEYNPLQHLQRQEQRQQNGSECSFGSGGGIGRGRIGNDGSPTSTSSNHKTQEESKASIENVEFNTKEVDETFWSNANWCVVDSYMTGHGKETTWTVRGFEEDDGVFDGNLLDYKDKSPLKIFANEKNLSPFSNLAVTQSLPIEAPNVETQHGPPPKWTQQALQERVAKNLLTQQEVRSSKNGLEMVKSLVHKQTDEGMDTEDGSKDKVKREEVVLDDLMSTGNMLYCRKGRKSMNEAVLKETRDKVGGGDLEASPDVNDIESASWKKVRRSSNACVGPSTLKSNQNKEILNLVTRREIQRRKRGWAKKKSQPPATNVACCVSMIGDTMKALRRTREDALKLAEFQEAELKAYKTAAFAMHIHVDLLQSEVQELEMEREFNVLVVFPWQQFLKNVVIGISLVLGTLGLHRALKSLFRLLFGQVVQTSTSKKEKTMVAVIILCSGSYVGKEMWQIFSQVHATKKRNEAVLQEKLRLICERLSHMSLLIYNNDTMHQGQAKDTKKTI